VPGRFCYVDNKISTVPCHEARLSFGVVPLEQIGEAIRRLGRAVQQTVKKRAEPVAVR
jgi:hypothetical protein